MTIERTATGFVVAAADVITVVITTCDGEPAVAIYADSDPQPHYPTYIIPHNPEDLGRIAYEYARRNARWTPHF